MVWVGGNPKDNLVPPPLKQWMWDPECTLLLHTASRKYFCYFSQQNCQKMFCPLLGVPFTLLAVYTCLLCCSVSWEKREEQCGKTNHQKYDYSVFCPIPYFLSTAYSSRFRLSVGLWFISLNIRWSTKQWSDLTEVIGRSLCWLQWSRVTVSPS